MNKTTSALLGLMMAAIGASPALAAVGAVKVECGESCDGIVLGAVCEAYVNHSRPVGIACDDTATPGYGVPHPCGTGTCTSYGSLRGSDSLGAYCEAGHGNDAIVLCKYGPDYTNEDLEEVDPDYDPDYEDKVRKPGDMPEQPNDPFDTP
jgi:hypothetical protein